MAENLQEQEMQQQGESSASSVPSEMDSFIETITDNAQKRAFRDTLNEDGTFNKEKIRDLAGRMLAERRNLSRINEMPDDVAKFKENFKPDEKYATLFDETNDSGKKVRDIFDKLDAMCMENTIGETKNKAIKTFLLNALADNGIIDVTTAEEKQAREEQRKENETAILQDTLGAGTDIDRFNTVIDQFIEDESDDDPDVKTVLDAIKTSAKGKLILYSLRNRIYGKPVPVMKAEFGSTKKALEREYNNPNTTRERRKEIAEKLNEMEGVN